MTYRPTCANLVLTGGDLRPAQANLHPAHADLHPARADLHPAHAENQPEPALGALFYGFFHVLTRVQQVCPSLEKVP